MPLAAIISVSLQCNNNPTRLAKVPGNRRSHECETTCFGIADRLDPLSNIVVFVTGF